jgi:hypothetical protein
MMGRKRVTASSMKGSRASRLRSCSRRPQLSPVIGQKDLKVSVHSGLNAAQKAGCRFKFIVVRRIYSGRGVSGLELFAALRRSWFAVGSDRTGSWYGNLSLVYR